MCEEMNMFSMEKRCRYRKHQLTNVICQFLFPEMPAITDESLALFYNAVRAEFPNYQLRQDIPAPKITGGPGNFSLENQPKTRNHQFSTPDGNTKINLTEKFISLSCANYVCWEAFAARLDQILVAFFQTFHTECIYRIGLRYLNVFSREALQLEGVPFLELISPCYLGPMGEPDAMESGVSRCTLDLDMAIRGGCRLKVHAGPGKIKRNGVDDQELKFVFDQDLYFAGKMPLNLATAALQTLHAQADSVFRGAITQRLHEAMEPEII